MNSLRKKTKVSNNFSETNNESSDDTNGESGDDEFVDEVVMVDFEGREIEGGDFEGIKRILRQLFLKASLDVSSIADIILQQNYIGSVIKQSEIPEDDTADDDVSDEDVSFGITTVINMTEKQDVPCIKQIRELLTAKSKKAASGNFQDMMSNILNRNVDSKFHTGFLISERLVNIPPQIAAPMLENLSKEIKAAQDKKQPFFFDRFIMICKVYKLVTKQGGNEVSSTVYSKPEDEIWHKEAIASFDYSISEDCDSALDGDWKTDDDGMKPFHLLLVLDAEDLDNITAKIKSTFTKEY